MPTPDRVAEDAFGSEHGPVVTRIALVVAIAAVITAAAPPVAVDRVVITRNGARSDEVSGDETTAVCRRFRLDAADVRRYFASAARVDQHAFIHDLDESRCHAAGTLRIAGRSARWFIDRERRGSLTFPDGSARYFYCLACRSPRFDEVDDETRATATALIAAARRRP
jgi:hypothetical protein